ncbi:nucleotidyl transferase AbiEii/AbiGii toxin family protein [Phaeospirillum tilakii]|uniref:Nucleotidyl transferase AbiEii/AbiGii toxin family protein n=1 Tax=Phaeospirillum tilakii TaxID=741673 RepID=A0ABW5CG03_9PROT
MFRRPRHAAVAAVLAAFDAELLAEAHCFFGGGTAIVLSLDEYRESLDVDFLCAAQDGYRLLRERVFREGFAGLLRANADVVLLREARADQYGIRTQIGVGPERVKVEIVREARIALSGGRHPDWGVPVLSREDMYCEKLLANADRQADRAVLNRDIIDLSMMLLRWGPVPETAWAKAVDAYGAAAGLAFARAIEAIRDPVWLRTCMERMAMDPDLFAPILALHGGPIPPEDERKG